MADEKPSVGGSASEILRELRKLRGMQAQIDRVERKVNESNANARRRASSGAKSEAERRPAPEAPPARVSLADSKKAAAATDESAVAAKKAAENTRRLAQAREELNRITGQAPANEARLKSTLAGVAQAQAGASQQMRRHGALTTEFLTAAARGEATLSEFRFQIGATIAKFAGWTAAASSVYGVVAALREVGSGAIDSLDAVNKLTRVISVPNKTATASGLNRLSERFNMPIGDVGAAVYEFAKIPENNTPAKALKASEAALYAVKVGELDAAEAGKLLISIQQGLGISSTELVGRFDQINQAQNRFGINIRDTTAGLAKSIGAFKAAGGDFDTALAIITTSSRVTGRSGEQIGTALQRSAGLIRRPKNQTQLRGFGIDPSQGISRIYEEAIKLAPTLSGRQRLQLATALSTPQLAPYLVGTLNRPDLYRQVRKETSPEASRGSAQRELNRQLNSAKEQIGQIANGLQRIGATLANIGAFNLFGGMLKGLNLTLDTVNHLLRLLEKVPEPIRSAGIAAAELYGVLRLMRRFNVGGAFAEGSIARRTLSANPLVYGRRQYLRAAGAEQQLYRDQLERTTVERGRVGFAAMRLNQSVPGLERDAQAAIAAGGGTRAQGAVMRLKQTQARIVELEAQMTELAVEEDFYRKQIAATDTKIAATRKMTNAQLVAEHRNYPVAPVGPPSAEGVRPLGRDVEGYATRSGIILPAGYGRISGGAPGAEAAATAQTGRLRAAMNRGTVGPLALRGFDAVSAKIGPARSALAGAGSAMARMGTGLKSLALSARAMLGPLDLILIGAIAIPEIYSAVSDKLKSVDAAMDRAATAPFTKNSVAALAKQHTRYKAPSPLERQLSLFNPFETFPAIAAEIAGNPTAEDIEREAASAQASREANARLIQRAQKRGVHHNYNLLPENLKGAVAQATRQRQAGVISLKQYDDALSDAIDNAARNANEFKGRKSYIEKLKELRRGAATTLGGLFPSGDAKGSQETLDALTSIAGTQFGSGLKVNALRAMSFGAARVVAETQTRDSSPQTLAVVSGMLDKFVKGIAESAKSQLDAGLVFARGQRARNRAYDRAIRSVRRGAVGGFDALIGETQRRISSREDQLATASLPRSGNAAQAGRLRQQLRADRETLAVLKQRRKEVAAAAKAEAQALADQKFDENQDLADATVAVQAASIGDKGQQVALQLRRIGDKLRAMIARYGRDSKQVQDVLLQQQQLLTQQAENSLDLIAARGSLAAAQDPTALGSANKNISSLQQQLAAVRGNKRLNDPTRVVSLQQQIAEAQKQRDQAVLDGIAFQYDLASARSRDSVGTARLAVAKAKAMLAVAKGDNRRQYLLDYYSALKALDDAKLQRINDEYDLLKSRTDDPVELAAIEARQALAILRRAKTKDDKLKGRAGVNNSRRNYANTLAEERMSDLAFDVEIGKITVQQEIAGLKNLLKIKNLGKAEKKKILQQIKRLENEGAQDLQNYELQVGDIRLPTVYEVRRAVQTAGRGVSNSNVRVTSAPTINVYVSRDVDISKIGDVLDQRLGTAVSASLRTQGY